MPIYNKYEKYQKYINGIPQDEYKQGELIGIDDYLNLEDCEEGAIYRWENTDQTVCNGYDLCVQQVKQKSLDGGKTWTNTTVVRIGEVIDSYSSECGYNPEYEWRPTGKYTCDSGFESEEFVYSYTLDGGKTWEIVQPAQYKYEQRALSNRCMMEAEPFSFVYDTERPGGSLTFYNQIGGWTDIVRDISPYSRYYYGLTKYIIDWGDGSDLEVYEKKDFYDHYESPSSYTGKVIPMTGWVTLDINSHKYASPGKYTVKAWGFIRGVEIIADKLISWGTSGITKYQVDPTILHEDHAPDELFIGGDCVEAVYIDGKRFMDVVKLNLIEGFPEPSEENFKVLNDYDNEVYSILLELGQYAPLNVKRLSGHMRFGLENSNIIEFDLSNVKVEEIALKNLPNLVRTPDFQRDLPDTYKQKYFQYYSIELCSSLKKAGPFSKMYNECLGTSILLGAKGFINFFQELYNSSPNLEEIDFGYCGFTDTQSFLKNFRKLKTLSGYFYEGSHPPEEGLEKTSFKEMFYESDSPIRNISNLIILGGDCTRMFANNDNLHNHCKFETYEQLGITPTYSETPTTIIADQMFDRCNVFTIDFDKGIENVSSANSMFSLNQDATTIKGEITNNSKIKQMNKMFSHCVHITSISPLFKNYTKELPSAVQLFSGDDKLKTIPEDFFNMEGTGYPMYMFLNTPITNYPIMDGVPVWEWDRFKYNGEIAKTLCFSGCYYIRDVVPIEWGGGNPSDEVVFSARGPIVLYNPNKINPGSTLIMYSSGVVNSTPDDSSLLLTSSSTYSIHVRYVEGTDVVLPYFDLSTTSQYSYPIYSEISNFGNINSFYYINENYYNYGFKTMGSRTGYYKNLYKTTTKLDLGVFASCTNLREPAYILKNATNVNEIINFNKYGSYLSTKDKTALLSPIHNLTTIDNFCSSYIQGYNQDGRPTTTTTLNIFKNNPKIISAKKAFYSCPITTVDPDELDNCTELTNVSGLFGECKELTNMPTFNGCKKITDFTEAFANCENLKGSTPVDENGYKLWERAGKPGYPETIDGRFCFHGCTKLDDYDEIPYYWK